MPARLFDIALFIDNPQIEDSRELAARVTFFSFGTEPTPVDMTFIVFGEKGNELYRSFGQTTIQTEGVFNKKFEDLVIGSGKYTLVLQTLYNTNVKDEFRAPFEVVGKKSFFGSPYFFLALAVLALILILYVKRRKKRNKQGKRLDSLRKEADRGESADVQHIL